MKQRLIRVGTEKGAREILKKMVESGKITIEDLDTESPSAALNRQIVEKYHPEIKLKPHRNLLRDLEPTESVQVTEPRDFDPRPLPEIPTKGTQIFRSENSEIHPEVNNRHQIEEIELPRELPF